jgi:carbonic anhydrase
LHRHRTERWPARAHWGELTSEFAACKTGHRQSPVNIVGAQSADLPAIQFEYKPSALHIINNGHTIQIDYASGSFIRVGDKRYELKQFHFHDPSEETVKNKRFPVEVHLVHSDADGNLAVVSVLLEEGSANPLVETLWVLRRRRPVRRKRTITCKSMSRTCCLLTVAISLSPVR